MSGLDSDVLLRIGIFTVYFGAVFAIGLYSLKRTRNQEDYWIAGGRLGWFAGGATSAATHTSAGTFIGTIGIIYTWGWSFAWLILTIPLAYWFLAAVLAPRFTRVRKLTLPAFLEQRYYSKNVRALAALIIVVATVVYIQAQIVAAGVVAQAAFGISEEQAMIGFTIILIAYTVVGGMIAVVYTDVAQLVIMAVGTVFAVPLVIRQVGGVDALFSLAAAANPITFTWGGLSTALLFTMGLSFFLGSVATPERLIRLYAMKDMRTIRRGILLAIVAICVLNFLVMTLALASISMFPRLPRGDLAMPLLAVSVLPTVIGSVMLAAITSAMMSTVDSLLIVAGSALAVDIYQNLGGNSVSERTISWVSRLGIVVVGSIPVLLLLSGIGRGELVQIIVLLFTALMASCFFAPVVIGVYWRRATREGAVAAMLGGLAGTMGWQVFGSPESIHPVLPGFLLSVVLLVGVSLATPRPPDSAVDPFLP